MDTIYLTPIGKPQRRFLEPEPLTVPSWVPDAIPEPVKVPEYEPAT